MQHEVHLHMSDGKLLLIEYQQKLLALLFSEQRLIAACARPKDVPETSNVGAIYVAKVSQVLTNIGACFVEIGNKQRCFLSFSDLQSPLLTNRAYDGTIKQDDELLVQVSGVAFREKLPSVTTKISLRGSFFVLVAGSPTVSISSKIPKHHRKIVREVLIQLGITDDDGRVVQGITSDGIPTFGIIVRTSFLSLLERDGVPLFQRNANGSCREANRADDLLLQQDEDTDIDRLPQDTNSIDTLLLGIPDALLQEVREEFRNLLEKARSIYANAPYQTCFSMLMKAPGVLDTVLQQIGMKDITEIITDIPDLYEDVCTYTVDHKNTTNIQSRLYKDPQISLCSLYKVRTRITEALDRRVWLKSGAYLIIEETEALVVIDVNTGKAIDSKEKASRKRSEAILKFNVEAACEIALQLRLRNLSGIIIVDFIKMSDKTHQDKLLHQFRHFVHEDPIPTSIEGITKLGLVELTRKRVEATLKEQLK
jgi:ribonuclease G